MTRLALACLLLAGCGGSGKAQRPTQLWPDGLYAVSVGGSTAHFAIAGPDVAVNGRDVATRMDRYFSRRTSRSHWQQVGTHGSVTFALRSGRQVRLTHDGRSVVVTAQRVSSNG